MRSWTPSTPRPWTDADGQDSHTKAVSPVTSSDAFVTTTSYNCAATIPFSSGLALYHVVDLLTVYVGVCEK